jgi:endonuclease/exonuclease/phosphatase family metal-dependent hydrolase
MQDDPLLVTLDWVFVSSSWTLSFRATKVQTLARPISDHCTYIVSIGTAIPKSLIFRFENY